MKAIKVILGALLVLGFLALGIKSVEGLNNTTQLKEIEFKTLDSQLDEKTIQIEDVNKQLDEATKNNQQSSEKVKELQRQKEQWEKEKIDYESKLQAKAAAKERLAKATVKVANAVTNTSTVSAISGNCDSWLTEVGITHYKARELIKRESRCEPCIYNDGSATGKIDCNYTGDRACGIPQSLPCSKVRDIAGCGMTNPICQLRWMANYVQGRYGSWDAAIAHHDAKGWY